MPSFERLLKLVEGGDLNALPDLAHEAVRRGDHALARRCARQLIDAGDVAVMSTADATFELSPTLDRKFFQLPTGAPILLLEPLRVELAWDFERAYAYVCDCAEHVLPLYEEAHEEDDSLRSLIEAAREGYDAARQLIAKAEEVQYRIWGLARDESIQTWWDVAYTIYVAITSPPETILKATLTNTLDVDGLDTDAEKRWQQQRLLQYLFDERR